MSIPDDDHDRSLLTAIARGDQEAFWTLWLRHEERLLAICLSEMNGNRVDAEDAHGQALLRAQQNLPRFASGVSNARSWLARVASNVCHDMHRARTRDARVEEQLAHQDRERSRELVYGTAREEPVTVVSGWDDDPEILIARLPDRLREIFVFRVVQNRPYREIALRFGVTSATARKRVQEARTRLRVWRHQPQGIAVDPAVRSENL